MPSLYRVENEAAQNWAGLCDLGKSSILSAFPCTLVSKGVKVHETGRHAEYMSVSLPLDTVTAGDHCDLRMSRQMLPLLFILG